MPDSLVDLLYVPVNPDEPTEAIEGITAGVEGHRERRRRLGEKAVTQVPPSAVPESADASRANQMETRTAPADEASAGFEPIRIVGVAKEGVGEPADDGTRGSALYRIPLRLSRQPSAQWAELFRHTWDRPPSFTTMHRPGIASVQGDTIVLDGTDMNELEQYHVETLRLVLDKVNAEIAALEAEERTRTDAEKARRLEHRQNVEDVADRLDFD